MSPAGCRSRWNLPPRSSDYGTSMRISWPSAYTANGSGGLVANNGEVSDCGPKVDANSAQTTGLRADADCDRKASYSPVLKADERSTRGCKDRSAGENKSNDVPNSLNQRVLYAHSAAYNAVYVPSHLLSRRIFRQYRAATYDAGREMTIARRWRRLASGRPGGLPELRYWMAIQPTAMLNQKISDNFAASERPTKNASGSSPRRAAARPAFPLYFVTTFTVLLPDTTR